MKARKLYEAIDFSKFAVVDKPRSYTMGDGKMRLTLVYKEDEVELLQGECEPGCKVEPHTHQQLENILLYEGEATVTVAGTPHHMTPGSTVAIAANTVHFTHSDVGCKVLVARMPPTEGIY